MSPDGKASMPGSGAPCGSARIHLVAQPDARAPRAVASMPLVDAVVSVMRPVADIDRSGSTEVAMSHPLDERPPAMDRPPVVEERPSAGCVATSGGGAAMLSDVVAAA